MVGKIMNTNTNAVFQSIQGLKRRIRDLNAERNKIIKINNYNINGFKDRSLSNRQAVISRRITRIRNQITLLTKEL